MGGGVHVGRAPRLVQGTHLHPRRLPQRLRILHQRVKIDELLNHIREQLNPLFKQQRQSDIDFKIERAGDAIEISQPELYPGDILYHIEVDGFNLNITRSEHYVDDVNSLTVESSLNDLFKNISGKPGTDLVLEG